ncbi:MAG: tetratricopeptide repeat protein [Flavobacteriaceae bacterium]|nr:tetratricopeptide repeat protein [Flavobacteriaceae bacterium]
MRVSVFHIIMLFVFSLSFSQSKNTFKTANELYNNGDYENALIHYQKIVDNGEHSASLYFNMGNAHYKLNRVAESIYNYEKALLMDPNNEEIKNNLGFAQKMTIDAIDAIPESGFSKMFNSAVGTFHFDTWAKIAIVFSILFVLSFIGYYFAYQTSRKRLLFISSGLSLLFLVASLFFAYQQESYTNSIVQGIVFAEESKVKAEPNLRSEESFKLHEGAKVRVLESVKDWKKIRLADGKTGWILAEDIKEL